MTSEVERAREVGGVEEPEKPRARANTSRPAPRRQRVDRGHRRSAECTRHDRRPRPSTTPTWPSRNSPSSLAFDEERRPLGERAAGVAASPCAAPPSRRVGRARRGEDRRRDVDDVHEPVALASWSTAGARARTRGRAPTATSSAWSRVRRAPVRRRSPRRVRGRRGRAAGRRADRCRASACARIFTACSSDANPAASRRARGPTPPPARPSPAGDDLVEARASPRRRRGAAPNGADASVLSRSRSTRPPGTLPALVISAATAARRYGGTARLRCARVAAVAVGDHRAGDARARQLVAEQPDLGAVQLAVVLVE